MKTRTMKVRITDLEASTGWSSSTVTIVDRTDYDRPRKVIVAIEDPSDVRYLRERLDEIESHWRQRLGVNGS